MTNKRLEQLAGEIIDLCEEYMDYYAGYDRDCVVERLNEVLDNYTEKRKK